MQTTLLPAGKPETNAPCTVQGNNGYYSAELPIMGLETHYHSKIRNDLSWPMSVLVREDSAILPFINEGDVINVKYYHANCRNEPDCLETAIREIKKYRQGPFRGHYQIALEIVSEKPSYELEN